MGSRTARGIELALAAVLLVVGCERSNPPAPAAASDGEAGPPEPPAPPDAADGGLAARRLPRIVDRFGPFLAQPRLTFVTFKNDDAKHVARVDAFGAVIMKTRWWHEVTADYCRGGECMREGTSSSLHLDAALPTESTIDELEALFVKSTKSQHATLDPEKDLFVLVLPEHARIKPSDGPAFCEPSAPRAYHRMGMFGPRLVAYAVVPRCADEEQQLASASHEILEASTNPDPAARGFALSGDSRVSGFAAAGVEPVDPCGLVTMDGHTIDEGGFPFHRAWSNRAAAAAHDPCVPSRADRRYALVIPRQPVVKLAHVGDTATVAVDASSAEVDTWTISAFDVTGMQEHDAFVAVSLDKSVVTNGDTAHLVLTAKKAPPKHRSVVGLVSTIGVGTTMWPLLVLGP